ncbi:hypothetical protein DL98DRAFT_515999 [Cadophora sp. DSE1049]|nr:hypothetical protein DL98DRAFT_515999 [Cadophora sp. DSE1049]
MASSADRDKDTSPDDKQLKPDNPFIKFRQFADTQISSLLQGIIGLPSAFSKRSSDDPRWAGIDDGLRRRDELQTRQKELKDSEARKLLRQTSDEEDQFTRTMDRTYFPGEAYQPLGERQNNLGMPTTDLPLYSAVKKSLFAHLQQPDFDEADWKDLKTPPTWGENGFLPQFYPLKLLSHQMPTYYDRDGMELTHCLAYNELNSSSSLRSEYSLLPYLLFSPYSPLKLEDDFHDRPYFPWRDAFEDLIALSQPSSQPSTWKYIASRMFGTPAASPEGNLRWVMKLQALGYLQEKKSMEENDHEALDYQLSSMLLEAQNKFRQWVDRDEESRDSTSNRPSVASPARTMKGIDHDLEATKSPRTEQEMYDYFLQWASSPQAIKEVFQAGEAFLSSLENDDMSGRIREQDGSMPRPPSLMKEILEVTKAFRELSQPRDISLEPEQQDKSSRETKLSESDRVVSSSTTTEQTVHEDGTIETCITVWKKFSSGRETSTTTHHCEDPATENAQTTQDGPNLDGSEKETNENQKDNKNGKSGWFWN